MQRLVHLACNDDRGDVSNRVSAIQIMDLELEPSTGWPLRITIEAQRFRVGGKWFVYSKSVAWVGNMAWNGYWMQNREAKRLLRHLRCTGHWQCSGGPVRLCDWYDRAARKAA